MIKITFATWSIIIIDPRTNEIGIAGASCTANVYGIGSIIPGKGAIIVQAMSNYNALDMGRKAIISGHSPEEILHALREDRFDPENQQYALVTIDHMDPKTYTGLNTYKSNGSITGYGISVQGNILANDDVLKSVYNMVVKCQADSLSIQETLLLALEAGSITGGDKRCGSQTSSSAFLMVARPDDPVDHLFIKLVIKGIPLGGENAVALLRKEYDGWKSSRK